MLQGKQIRKQLGRMRENEREDFAWAIAFWHSRGHSEEELAGIYLAFIRAIMEEAVYFRQHGHYRYRTVAEAEEGVYCNEEYMATYVAGMSLNQYLSSFNLLCMRLYEDFIKGRAGSYLEIGPGHGEQLYAALRYADFSRLTAVDISPTSIEMARQYLSFRQGERQGCPPVEFCCEDFLQFSGDGGAYDTIVMSAVLEHLERPLEFLQKIRSLSHAGTRIYMTASMNTPARDHLYLFTRPEEVLSMAREAGLSVERQALATHNGRTAEEACRRKEPAKIAMVLRTMEATGQKG